MCLMPNEKCSVKSEKAKKWQSEKRKIQIAKITGKYTAILIHSPNLIEITGNYTVIFT
ncbi:hypothetical protein [Paenibacillus qinlingensis]|uniref:Uncharacterized protein n=1 Tax=Paenibacillus qinlingensis TaxID=1837343 RepID=A0ABU1P4P4_9BACL|nr:hypothetical protein [Paenibacillus qinlingensis]MDR6554715.1 hypothetical protein [Paenibacillus qinlingensis]